MRIGIDIREIYDPKGGKWGGIGLYILCVVKEIIKQLDSNANDLVLFTRKDYDAKELLDLSAKIKIVKIPEFNGPAKHFKIHKIFGAENLDILWGPANYLPFFYKGKSVITIHDLAIYSNPEWFPSGQWFSKRFLVPSSIKKANKIFAVSKFTKQDVIKLFGVAENKVDVVYEGLTDNMSGKIEEGFENVSRKFGLEKNKYLLFLGTLEPRKNLRMLIEAYFRIKKFHPDIKLVLGGKIGWNSEKILKDSKTVHGVVITEYLTKEEKWMLLKNALVLAFPSLFEGFGLPILEAQSVGVPVLTSNTSSMPEVGGDSALYVDPEDLKSIAEGLLKIIEDEELRKELISKGHENVKRFSFEKAAREILNSMENL